MRYRITAMLLVVVVITTGLRISLASAVSNNPSKETRNLITSSQYMVAGGGANQAKSDLEQRIGSSVVFLPLISRHECTVTLDPGSVDYDGGSVPPRGVVCLNEGDYAKIVIRNLRGTAERPITIRNYGGLVRMTGSNGIQLRWCEHVHLTGTGTPGVEYGFYFRGQLRVYEESHHIEIDHVEMDGARMRIYEVDDANFEMTDIHVHHNYIHDIDNTAIYIGWSNYDEHPGDYVMRRVEVDHNHLDTVNKGIQVGSCVEGCTIHHNKIHNAVVNESDDLLRSAIMINQGTDADVYNNLIDGCKGPCICGNDGYFDHEIYNNLLIDCGNGEYDKDAFITWSERYSIYNNTIIGAGRYGLNFATYTMHENEAFNNIILDTVGDPIHKGGSPDASFHRNLTKDDGYTPANFVFVYPANNDYHLTESSPAIDAGATPPFPLTFDLDDRSRPVGAYDIGAYEFGGIPLFVTTPTP
jgi:hypothetical protein